jgi:GTP-binding protein EngB required for normal cell division
LHTGTPHQVDLWRVVRLLNPLAAATQELRERFTRQIYEVGREHLARRLARAFVKEIGRAAIDLCGGNLRVTNEQLTAHVTAASRKDSEVSQARDAEPVRVLVAGQIGAGKSSLVNALANAVEAAVDALPATASFTAHTLTHEGLPAAVVIDSPGLTAKQGFDELIEAADNSDMMLWVCSAARAAREIDAHALSAVRAHFAADLNRHRPPMLLVLTHVDSLRPFNEWEPPYDLADATRAKSRSIRGAMEAASTELGKYVGRSPAVPQLDCAHLDAGPRTGHGAFAAGVSDSRRHLAGTFTFRVSLPVEPFLKPARAPPSNRRGPPPPCGCVITHWARPVACWR